MDNFIFEKVKIGNVRELYVFAGLLIWFYLFMSFNLDLKNRVTGIGSLSSSSSSLADGSTVLQPYYVILWVSWAWDGFQSFLILFYVILGLNLDRIRFCVTRKERKRKNIKRYAE